MSHNSNDVSLIFEKAPDTCCNVLTNELQTDEKVKVNVPDLSVFSEIATENENADCKWKSTISKNKYCKSPMQLETFLTSTTSKKQCVNKVQCHCLQNQFLHNSSYCSSNCELSNGLPLKNQGFFDSESFPNGFKSNNQLTDKVSFNNFSNNFLEKRDFNFSNDVMEHLRQQDKKFNDLQNQITLFLQHKNFSCQAQNVLENEKESIPDCKTSNSECCSKSISVQNNPKVDEFDQNFILMYIKEHSDQICKIQYQIDLLLKRIEKLESLYSRTEKLDQIDNLLRRIEKLESHYFVKDKDYCDDEKMMTSFKSSCAISPNDDASSIQGDQNCHPDQNEVVCHEEKKVKKSSTSTMTSLTFEGNEKLVFRKMLTVVTDVSNCQKNVSIQCPQKIDSTEAETMTKIVRTESSSPKNEMQITSKSVDSKKQKRKHLKSPKKSLNRNRKSNRDQVCQKTQEILSPPNAYSSATLPKFRSTNPDYASSDSDRENKIVNNILSPKEKILFEISRNIDQHIETQDYKGLPLKSNNNLPERVSKHHKSCKINTPHTILSSAERNKNCRKSSSRSSSASSNTSEEVYASPNQRDKIDYPTTYSTHDSSVVSKYGMSSPNLSLATKLYLDKFGLVNLSEPSSPDDKTEREFTRTLDCRRQLR